MEDMRYTADDTLWVVLDPTPASELADICFAATLRDLEQQFRGGLSCDRSLTLFTDHREAEAEAAVRMVARRAARDRAK